MFERRIVMTDEELMKKLWNDHDFNPWLEVADKWLAELNGGNHNGDYIHPNDGAAIADYKEKLNRAFSRRRHSKGKRHPRKKNMELVLDLLPQPFIGNPCAPIWVLLKNPGYSSIDVYDLKSINGGKKEISKSGKIKKRDLRYLNVSSEEQLLRMRQTLICRQLKFDFDDGKEFYILRNRFNTLKENYGSRKVFGGYNWYMRYFFPEQGCLKRFVNDMCELKIASQQIFVLEYDPYHSQAYFESNVDFKHHILWKNLIEYGIKSKVIIARGGGVLKHIIDCVSREDLLKASNERRLFLFRGQSASFTVNNLYWPCLEDDPINPLARK